MKSGAPKKPKRRQRFLPRAIGRAGGIALAGAAFAFFWKQAKHVMDRRADRYDDMVMETIHRIDNRPMHTAMLVVTQLGSHAAISTAAGLTAIELFRKGHKDDAWTVIVSTGGAMVINTVLKNVFERQRPADRSRHIKLPDSHSFPSGHSLLSAATYPVVVHHLVQNASARTQALAHAGTALTVASVGFSRVYFGVHFPSDVLGGFAAGLGWLGLTSLSHTAADKQNGRR